MNGILKYNGTEWFVNQEGQDRVFPIHPEQHNDMYLFDRAKEYYVMYSLCYLVEHKLYCVKIAKSSFPVAPIPTLLVDGVTNIEIIDGDDTFYIGNNLIVEVGYVQETMKLFISKK